MQNRDKLITEVVERDSFHWEVSENPSCSLAFQARPISICTAQEDKLRHVRKIHTALSDAASWRPLVKVWLTDPTAKPSPKLPHQESEHISDFHNWLRQEGFHYAGRWGGTSRSQMGNNHNPTCHWIRGSIYHITQPPIPIPNVSSALLPSIYFSHFSINNIKEVYFSSFPFIQSSIMPACLHYDLCRFDFAFIGCDQMWLSGP